jgi:hypothetical protein
MSHGVSLMFHLSDQLCHSMSIGTEREKEFGAIQASDMCGRDSDRSGTHTRFWLSCSDSLTKSSVMHRWCVTPSSASALLRECYVCFYSDDMTTDASRTSLIGVHNQGMRKTKRENSDTSSHEFQPPVSLFAPDRSFLSQDLRQWGSV